MMKQHNTRSDWQWIEEAIPVGTTVHEQPTSYTGILDKDGQPIYREKEPLGFGMRQRQPAKPKAKYKSAKR